MTSNVMSPAEARNQWLADRAMLEMRGIVLPEVQSYALDGWKHDYHMALDAQPALATAANSAIPAMLTTTIDPDTIRILFTPNKAAQIVGEVKKGTWLDETVLFHVVEHTGEVTSYGDYNPNGRAGANQNWPARQSYLYQTVKEYGDREVERAGLGRLNWVQEIETAAALAMDKFQNYSYFFGISGLQCYGLMNDPTLSASITPLTKAAGGTAWTSDGAILAQANEIYNDIQSLYIKLVQQTAGLVTKETKMTLAMAPESEAAMLATNSFNVSVADLLKKNLPNLRIETAVQFGAKSAANPQGVLGGNLLMLIADNVEGQKTAFCAYNEKMRAHPIVRELSSYKQKLTGGTWGTVIRMPLGIVSMLGV